MDFQVDLPAGYERRQAPPDIVWNDEALDARPIAVAPGQFVCSDDPEVVLVAALGAGVAVCIHDPEVGVGGMAYLLLSDDVLRRFPRIDRSQDADFLRAAGLVEDLIGELKRHGAGKNRIRIRMFGGTSIFEDVLDGGLKNYILTKDMVTGRGLVVAGEDIGGEGCRRLRFFPASGQAVRLPLRRSGDIAILRDQERAYLDALPAALRQPS